MNAIGSVIKDPMELPEKDITTVDAILFVQNTLKEGSDLYNKGEYEASWRNYIRRGNEFLTKYSKFISSSQSNKIRNVILDDQPVAQLAAEAWKSRNASAIYCASSNNGGPHSGFLPYAASGPGTLRSLNHGKKTIYFH